MTPKDGDEERRGVEFILEASRKFEYVVVLVLICAIGLISMIALARLFVGVVDAAFFAWDPKDYRAIQLLFGMVMTVLIALEFGNSILKHLHERSTIIQAREVILIGMMALVRKIMIIDLASTPPLVIASLGVVAVALSGAYWFMRTGQ